MTMFYTAQQWQFLDEKRLARLETKVDELMALSLKESAVYLDARFEGMEPGSMRKVD